MDDKHPSPPADTLVFELTMNGKRILGQNMTGIERYPQDIPIAVAAALLAEGMLLDWHPRLAAAIAEGLRNAQ